MITTGGKLWFAITAFALGAAVVYFLATGGDDGGTYTLLFIAAGAATIGGAAVATRDGDATLTGSEEGTREPVVVRSALPAPWPALGILGVAFIIIAFSRVLLALPDKTVSTAVALVVAAIITAAAFTIAHRPRIGSGALSWMLAIGAVVLAGAGIFSGVVGEREIEHHEADHGAEEGTHPDEGTAGEGDGGEGTIGDDGSHDDQEEPAE